MTWHYSNTSAQTSVDVFLSSVAPTVTVASASGFPVSYPYTVILDYGQSTREVANVTSAVGNVLTITRGQDGTSASNHSVGAVVVHGIVARDLSEPQAHIAATTDVHGIGGASALVGTATSQTLTNKSIDGGTNTLTNIPGSAVVGTINAAQVDGTFDGLQVVTSGGGYVALDVADASASRTAHYVDIRNTNSNKGFIIGDDAVVTVDDTDLVVDTRRALAAATPAGRIVAKTNGKPALILDRPSAGTSNLQEWWANGSSIATVDKDAKLSTRGHLVKQIAADTTTLLLDAQNSSNVSVASLSYLGRLTAALMTVGGVDLTGAWTSYTPTWVASAGTPAIGNGTLAGLHRLFGKTGDVSIMLTAGSTTTYGTAGAYWTFSLPSGWVAASDHVGLVSLTDTASEEYGAYCRVVNAGTTIEFFKPVSGRLVNNSPFTFGNTDIMRVSIKLQIA